MGVILRGYKELEIVIGHRSLELSLEIVVYLKLPFILSTHAWPLHPHDISGRRRSQVPGLCQVAHFDVNSCVAVLIMSDNDCAIGSRHAHGRSEIVFVSSACSQRC